MGTQCLSPVILKRPDGLQLRVQCNHCLNCSIRRQLAWTIRLCLERQSHASCSFVTLTYAEEERPGTLIYRDVQLFLKRLRRTIRRPVRFFCCGQYGTRTGREHWHAILYGVTPLEMAEKLNARSGITRFMEAQYLAERPTALWPHGGSHITEVNSHRAAYVARYSLKTGPRGDEYVVRMSRKPGIGLDAIGQIGAYFAGRVPRLEVIPGWWRMGRTFYSLDKSAREAFQSGYEAAGGVVTAKERSRLSQHSEARLWVLCGDLLKASPHYSIDQLERKAIEHGTL